MEYFLARNRSYSGCDVHRTRVASRHWLSGREPVAPCAAELSQVEKRIFCAPFNKNLLWRELADLLSAGELEPHKACSWELVV